MAEEWNMPEFLNRDFEDIMEEMAADLPQDIDLSEGSHSYNLLAPTAMQEAYFTQYIMAEAVKRIFPRLCEGYSEYVDYHAEVNGITRKAAARAGAVLVITGAKDTVIPAGTVFSTAAVGDAPSVAFVSVEEAAIGETGTAQVFVKAEETGSGGNVAAGTIILQDTPLDGISAVTNPQAASGGTDEESDASLIERIMEYEKMQGLSFVGNDSDYKRWAEEVDGTGTAIVVPPEEDDDSGTVTIVLTDSEGNPATETLCQKVYDYIVSPNDRDKRKAPVNGAALVVTPPSIINLVIAAQVTLTEGAELETVKAEFIRNISAYMAQAPEDREVRYTRIGAILSRTEGIADYDAATLTLNGGTNNIPVAVNAFPRVDSGRVTLSESV
ncbi:baseplate J/gp47 family protein [Ihubacter sp. mB4P-1]|uniref:baseplate J/gp47 family protein n=1 Tax=Ihubacter sp. mB4P-1 TaxID=3242370 RepID=UPI0013798DF9